MLKEILKLLNERGAMSLKELSIHFRTEVSAMEGMLRTLERKGRIEQIGGGKCATCKGCALIDPADVTVFKAADEPS
jgi:predicted transcriptional regulator